MEAKNVQLSTSCLKPGISFRIAESTSGCRNKGVEYRTTRLFFLGWQRGRQYQAYEIEQHILDNQEAYLGQLEAGSSSPIA